jgi:hypothetical protein
LPSAMYQTALIQIAQSCAFRTRLVSTNSLFRAVAKAAMEISLPPMGRLH